MFQLPVLAVCKLSPSQLLSPVRRLLGGRGSSRDHRTLSVLTVNDRSRNQLTDKEKILLPQSIIQQSNYVPINTKNTRQSQILQQKNYMHTQQNNTHQRTSLAAGFVSSTPISLQPYLKLIRLDRPVGSWLLFWPCGWSLCLATSPGAIPDLGLLALFGVGSLVMRGAGCTINDMMDKNIDCLVERTRDRPITSGQISMFESLVFLGGQLGLGLFILLQLNWYSVLLGAASLGLVITYPLMKRFTYYPQFVLGLTFNWGALMGWSAVNGSCDWSICLPLYIAGISWTMIYDTIYAHQDKYDDVIVGVKSTAIKFGEQTPACLSCFATTMMASLAYCGWATDQTIPYYLSLLVVGGHLSHQILTLDIDDGDDCAQKFRSNRWVGLCVFLGLMSGTLMKENEEEDGEKHR